MCFTFVSSKKPRGSATCRSLRIALFRPVDTSSCSDDTTSSSAGYRPKEERKNKLCFFFQVLVIIFASLTRLTKSHREHDYRKCQHGSSATLGSVQSSAISCTCQAIKTGRTNRYIFHPNHHILTEYCSRAVSVMT